MVLLDPCCLMRKCAIMALSTLVLSPDVSHTLAPMFLNLSPFTQHTRQASSVFVRKKPAKKEQVEDGGEGKTAEGNDPRVDES